MGVVVARQHPFLSPLGCGSALAILAAVGLSLIFLGGQAFSPGALSAVAPNGASLNDFDSHAEFEADCDRCHAPWQGLDPARCEACHTGVADQRASLSGLHGRLDPVEAGECAECHPDHLGRDFDSSAVAMARLDHRQLGFELVRHRRDYAERAMTCDDCHAGTDYALLPGACDGCHRDADPAFVSGHVADFGDDCLTCHDGADRMLAFDHSSTAFTLEGAHASVACRDCHAGQPLADAPAECAGCHAEPAGHAGTFADGCADCHSATAWSPAVLSSKTFAHAATRFTLITHRADFDGTPLTCADCHAGLAPRDARPDPFAEQACDDCHRQADAAFVGEHVQVFGGDCLSCHDGSGNLQNFDHDRVFVLDGAHASLDCGACHADRRFKGTPRDCLGCHAEPVIHAGVFGVECANCHTTTAWSPARLVRHSFPLDHGEQGEIACETCHVRIYVEYTCNGCHEHDPAKMQRKHAEKDITGARLEACVECHPTGREEEGD